MAYYRRRPTFLNDGQIPANPDAPLSDTARYFYGQVTSDPVNEAFLAGKDAARKEATANATDATRRENRPEWWLLIEAIKAVSSNIPLEDSDKFAESILKEVRAELKTRLDPETRRRLARRKKPYPSESTIRAAIRFIPTVCGKT
jgi:hypothetical protein